MIGWTWLSTTINAATDVIQYQCNGSTHYHQDISNGENIYCHDDAASEPVTDGLISSGPFVGSEVEYSGVAGVIHSFTSLGSFFSSDQNLSLGDNWTIYYNARVTGVDSGYTAFIAFSFYKRDISNNDTFLWSKIVRGISGFYNSSGLTTTTTPAGSVTTSDRLRIRVSMGQEAGK